jgi:phospholipase D1/2
MAFWIFVPTIYVRGREGGPRDPNDRLDVILKKKADEGVKIRILLWDETNFAMSNYSKWNKHYLEDLTADSKEPIVVVRHPQYKPLLFSHHQKFVVIDDKHAYIGGVDFATGRYDTGKHDIVDVEGKTWWGIDFYAPLLKKATSSDFAKPDADIIDRSKTSSMSSFSFTGVESSIILHNTGMPWHDIQMYVDGEAARDAAFNFVQRWNHHVNVASKYAGKEKYTLLQVAGFDDYDKAPPAQQEVSQSSSTSSKKGKVDMPVSEKKKRKAEMELERESESKSGFGADIDEEDEEDERDGEEDDVKGKSSKSRKQSRRRSDSKKKDREIVSAARSSKKSGYSVTCQVIRSISQWSGSSRTENSIHAAYVNAINNAEHFVYFENQFFISGTAPGVANGIGQALVERISLAIKNKQKFRVVILTTQPEDLGPKVVPVVTLQYMTINRGHGSICSQLRDRFPGIDVTEYVNVVQLRNHGFFADGAPTSEQIFVHSKLLIVDDRVCVIASANLNDRSFIGNRDSELGVVVLDGPNAVSKMGGKDFSVNKFVWALRKQLYMEHLGLDPNDPGSDALVMDPASDEFYHGVWRATARLNSDIYESVFPHIARDSILTYEDFVARQALKPNMSKVEKLKQTKGHLCLFPLQFLAAETPKLWETFVDDAVFN